MTARVYHATACYVLLCGATMAEALNMAITPQMWELAQWQLRERIMAMRGKWIGAGSTDGGLADGLAMVLYVG